MMQAYRAITMISLLSRVCFLESAEADDLDVERLLESVGVPRGAVIVHNLEMPAQFDLADEYLVLPKRKATLSLEEALEERAEFLSLGQSSIAFLDDILASLEQEMQAIQPLKRIFLQQRLPSHRGRLLKLSKSQEETLHNFRERYGILALTHDEEMIERIERTIAYTRCKVEQIRGDNVVEIQRMEGFLQGSPSDEQWVSIFKYLLCQRFVVQPGLLTAEDPPPQDLRRLSFSENTRVMLSKELFAQLDRRIYLVYHFLPVESLGMLEPILRIPSLRMYLNGYRQNPDNPDQFISMVTKDGGVPCFIPEPFPLHAQKILDIEYIATHPLRMLIPDYADAIKLLDKFNQPLKAPLPVKPKPKKKTVTASCARAAVVPQQPALVPSSPHPLP